MGSLPKPMHISQLRTLCLLATYSLTAFSATPQFSTRQDIAIGFQRLSVIVTGDFNGDGKLDIATTDLYEQRIVVYLNTGNGTFAPPLATTLQIANGTGALLVGDFNEDGKQDLIVSLTPGPQDTQSDMFLAGKGDGTFQQGVILPGSYAFEAAVAVDLNHDHHLDFVEAANGMFNRYLGDGTGNFQMQTLTVNPLHGDSYLAVASADFNGDNNPDLLVAGQLDKVIYYLPGNGDGTFGAASALNSPSIQSPGTLAVADFNGDHHPDLLTGAGNNALVSFGNGDGTFQLAASQIHRLALPPYKTIVAEMSTPLVGAADMDVDGSVDVVAIDERASTLNLFLNDGSGTFPQTTPDFTASLDAATNRMQLVDINGDGLPDIILSNFSTNKISVFLSIRSQITPTITLTTGANQQLIGTPLTFTAKATGLPISSPTGTVTLLDGMNSLGQQTLNSSGQAIFTLAGLTSGQHSLSVSYAGDQYDSPAASAILVENVTDFQIALASTSQTVTRGSTAIYTLNLTPIAGLTGSATFSCTGLPSGSTCTTSSVALNGQPASATVTVTTSSTHAQAEPARTRLSTLASVSLATLLFVPLVRRRRLLPSHLAMLALCLAFLGTISGCGGGSSTSTSSTTSSTPTTTSFTITGSVTQGAVTVSRPVMATLTIN